MDDARDRSATLLERWQTTGDTDALDDLLRIELGVLRSRLRRKAKGLLRPSMSATDVAQEAVVRMLRVRDKPHFDDSRELRAYLWKAAWRLLRHRLRKRRHALVRLDQDTSSTLRSSLQATTGPESAERRERSVALNLTLNLLRPHEREVLDLVYFQEQGIDGAAKRLGITSDAAKMRLVRARRKLATKLRHWTDLIG